MHRNDIALQVTTYLIFLTQGDVYTEFCSSQHGRNRPFKQWFTNPSIWHFHMREAQVLTKEPKQMNVGMLHLFNVSLLPVINFDLVYVFLPLTDEYFTPVKDTMIFVGYYLLEVYILFQQDNKYSNRPFLIRFYLYSLEKTTQFAQIRPRRNESIKCPLLQGQLKPVAVLVYNCLWKGFALKRSASGKNPPSSTSCSQLGFYHGAEAALATHEWTLQGHLHPAPSCRKSPGCSV